MISATSSAPSFEVKKVVGQNGLQDDVKQMDYTLNKKVALQKKYDACDRRENCSTQISKNNCVMVLNTAAFEMFKNDVSHHLQECGDYKLPQPVKLIKDADQNITQDTLKVHSNEPGCAHLFTINFYRTTGKVLVNGPKFQQFVDNVLPAMKDRMDGAKSAIWEMNNLIKIGISNSPIVLGEQPSDNQEKELGKRNRKSKQFDEFVSYINHRKSLPEEKAIKNSTDEAWAEKPKFWDQVGAGEWNAQIAKECNNKSKGCLKKCGRNNNQDMVRCDGCGKWTHTRCLENFVENNEDFVCETCGDIISQLQKSTTEDVSTTALEHPQETNEMCKAQLDQQQQTRMKGEITQPSMPSPTPKSTEPTTPNQHIQSLPPKPTGSLPAPSSSPPKTPPRSPPGRRKSKCSNVSCENLHVRIKTLEKEKIDLRQKIETLESHQNTLRATITAKEALLKEEQLKSQVHNNLAMMFLDEMVDEGESITTEERAKKVADMQEIHAINNNLQEDLKEMKKNKKVIEEKLSNVEKDNDKYVARIKSLEETHKELDKYNLSLKNSITKHVGTIQDLSCKLEERKNEIEKLSSRNSILEENLQQNEEANCVDTSEQTKTREDLEIDVAYLEKNVQDQAHQLLLANDYLEKMKENWDRDKARMLDFEMKLSQTRISMKNLNDKLDASEAQLKQSRSLNNNTPTIAQRENNINVACHPETPHRHIPENMEMVGPTNEETQANEGGGTPNGQENENDPVPKEICIFELVEKGRCRRKDRCKFNHEIEPHAQDQSWKDAKLAEMSKKMGRCAVEMTGKGSCPKKNQCMFPHLNSKMSHRGYKDLCFSELEEAGKCQRGSSCRYSHAISQEMRDDRDLQRKVQEKKQSKKGICINEFRCPNSCLKAERCTFRHDISEEEKQSKVLKEKMEQKWKTITGQTSNAEETLDKSTAIVMLQEFRNLMKNFNKVMGSHRP